MESNYYYTCEGKTILHKGKGKAKFIQEMKAKFISVRDI